MKGFIPAVLLCSLAIVARADNVYVAGFYTGTIQKFNTNGIGSSFVGGLNGPEQITFDAAGNLYIANYGNNNILKYTTNGVGSTFASLGGGPNGLAFDKAGNLYVATFDSGIIEKFSPSGTDLGTFASGLVHPIGLIFDTASNLYVSTYDNLILKFTPGGSSSTFVSGVNRPIGMAFDRGGNLYVANFDGDSVTKFGPNGALIGDLATNGLSQPYFIGFDSATNLYVANFGNSTVRKITATGSSTQFASMASACSLAVWPGLSLVVTNNVIASNPPPFGLSLRPTAPGQMVLRFFGNTNNTFTVLATTNPFLARSNWVALGAASLQASNLYQFTDTHATNVARFYSVQSP